MSLANLIRKWEPKAFATATPATFATQLGERAATVARVATVAVANSPEGKTASQDDEAKASHAEIASAAAMPEFVALMQIVFAPDSAVDRTKYNLPTVPDDDDRRTCNQCLNLRMKVCTIAAQGAMVSANRGYRPDPSTLLRCIAYLPNKTDTNQQPGRERWPGL